MSGLEFLLFFITYFLYFGLLSIPYFRHAERKPWEALIPIYNVFIMVKIIQRPWWWTILAILPVVGNVMMVVIMYELLHVYRQDSFKRILLATLTAGLYFGYLGYVEKLEYQGRDIKVIRKHISELASSLIFAVVAATVIRAFTFEAFTIPTPSMEKSLMVGDYLFVSKLHYGVRVPMTPFSLPLVHNRLPFSTANSYLDWVQFPYYRLPAFTKIERNDPIVFNYPAEDIRPINMEGEDRPIDKREHYVKRVIGMPGDAFEVRGAQVFINGEPNELPPRAIRQHSYIVVTDAVGLSERTLQDQLGLSPELAVQAHQSGLNAQGEKEHRYLIDLPDSALKQVLALPSVDTVAKYIHQANLNNPVFPNPPGFHSDSLPYPWSRDNYGPLHIPAKGEQINLNEDNYHKYARVIRAYEGHRLERENKQYLIDGAPATTYTFEQDYYFMIGDNRHRSDDSRFWGFVPADHIVGKPVFIWMSFDKYGATLADKIRFDRVFTTVSGSGERRSYFWPFVVVVAGISLFNRYRKKKRKKGQA